MTLILGGDIILTFSREESEAEPGLFGVMHDW